MTEQRPKLEAIKYADGTVSYPGHPVSQGGAVPVEKIDLTEKVGTIITWTSSTATPPGVRSPNHLGIVEFDLEADGTVRVIGQLTTDNVTIGDQVEPIYVEQLRDPDEGIRTRDSHRWDGYRFAPIE